MNSRRKFLTQAGTLAMGAMGTRTPAAGTKRTDVSVQETLDLCGQWWFRTDSLNVGEEQRWHGTDEPIVAWRMVQVPHTWQVEPAHVEYRSVAWYRRTFDAPPEWQNSAVRIEFEAVFHTATVWINGELAGEHARNGYMLPRGRSSDWAHDGGIYRPVQLLITPKIFAERVDVDAVPDLANGDGKLAITAYFHNTDSKPWTGRASFRIIDDETGQTVVTSPDAPSFTIKNGATQTEQFVATVPNAKLWHFDLPNLYRLIFSITSGQETHRLSVTFGVRKLEVKDGGFYLNGERVRLIGVERMAGSNPEFGMAEPSQWITHDHDDLKDLNCVFTRVHWAQDKRVLDYCDRHGILMQTEVPAWGWDSFGGMRIEPDAEIMENGLEQLREMIARDRNHPSVVAWGLCNEVGGQHPPAHQFARHMLEEAKRLDPNRLCSYASNSLIKTPEQDAAGMMDIVEVNEYFGTWVPQSPEALALHLESLHAAFPGKPIV